MIGAAGYTHVETLHGLGKSVVTRAIRDADGRPVILKALSASRPEQRDVFQLRNEYELLNKLSAPGLPAAYDLGTWENSPVVVAEDIGGISLNRLLETKGALATKEFLEVAVQVADAVSHLHSMSVVHKDITPGNIVWNSESRRAQLIDLGIATELSREVASVLNPGLLEGTLAYMSPEQTGRMNRASDYRTDLYSLGASFFHALTGRRPFETVDFMGLVHCHLARRPPAVHELRTDVPPVLGRIVGRLLEKSPEDRYQSARVLGIDLRRCLAELDDNGAVADFAIAQRDVSDRFSIPERLYGREREIDELLRSFDRACGGSKELMLIAGYSGIGKSALVRELHRPIVAKRGFFTSGKCDQLENVPFSCLIQACKGLIRQVLTGSADEVVLWKERLSQALGANGKVVSEEEELS
jgi:serine/threonine protein kinase